MAALPEYPTLETPGSPGKIAVMAGRAERGELLFHPDDAGMRYRFMRVAALLEWVRADAPDGGGTHGEGDG